MNRKLLPIKATYFLWFAGYGSLIEFIPVYFKQLRLSATEVGVIYGVMPFIAFLVRPLFGVVSDKTGSPKAVLVGCILLSAVAHTLLLLAPRFFIQIKEPDLETKSVQFECSQDGFKGFKCIDNGGFGVSCSFPCYVLNSSLKLDAVVPRSREINCICTSGEARNRSLCFSTQGSADISVYSISSKEQNSSALSKPKYAHLVIDRYKCRDEERSSFFNCSMTNFSDTLQCLLTSADSDKSEARDSKLFWIITVVYLFCTVFFSPVPSLVDAIAFSILGEKRKHFGRQRLWGTVGFAILVVTSSFLMDKLGQEGEIDYSISFYMFVGFSCLTALLSTRLESTQIHCSKMVKNFLRLFRYPEINLFLFIVTCFGVMRVYIGAFLLWYMKDLGSSQLNMGLSLAFRAGPEVLCLFSAGRILTRFGHRVCLYLVFVAFAVRFFCYSAITNPWYILPVEMLHGITFGLMYPAATSYSSSIAPPGMEATLQGLFGGLYAGLGSGIGSIISGKLMDEDSGVGPVWTFRIFGIFAATILILNIAIDRLCFTNYEHETNKALQVIVSASQTMKDNSMTEVPLRPESESDKHDTKLENVNQDSRLLPTSTETTDTTSA